jgi:AcrR family transcriptional regulator
MARNLQEDRNQRRRRLIIEAARECFLKFGYPKTSLEDIAKHAGISRPLIYLTFKSKEEIFGAVYEAVAESCYAAAEKAITGDGGKRKRLMRLYEALLLEPWDQLSGAPMASEFYEACGRILPELQEKHEKLWLKYTQTILKTKELSEVFMLAVEGLHSDVPSTSVLRKRMEILVDQFTS